MITFNSDQIWERGMSVWYLSIISQINDQTTASLECFKTPENDNATREFQRVYGKWKLD